MDSYELSAKAIRLMKDALLAAPPPLTKKSDIDRFFDRYQEPLTALLLKQVEAHLATRHANLDHTARQAQPGPGSKATNEWPAWQTLDEFAQTPSALKVPVGSVLAVVPDQETAQTLIRFPRKELQILASFSGATKGGSKNLLAHKIVDIWNLRKELAEESVETLEKRPGADLRRLLDALGLFKGGNKHTKAVQIINWRNERRTRSRHDLAEAKWLFAIQSLVSRGLVIPRRTHEDLVSREHGWLLVGDTAEHDDEELSPKDQKGVLTPVAGMQPEDHESLSRIVENSIAHFRERLSDPVRRRETATAKLSAIEQALLRQFTVVTAHEPGQAGYSDSSVSPKKVLYRRWFRQNAATLLSLAEETLNPDSQKPILERVKIELLRNLPASITNQTMLPKGSVWEVENKIRAGDFFYGWEVRPPGQGIHAVPKESATLWTSPPLVAEQLPSRYDRYLGWHVFTDASLKYWAVRGRIALTASDLASLHFAVDNYIQENGTPSDVY